MVGCNSRLDSIQAAILRIKLQHLDKYCDARRKVADYYDNALKGHANIVTPFRAPYSKHVFHQYTLQLKNVDRDEVQKLLAERHVPSMIYYPVPCHKQNMLKEFVSGDINLPVTNMLQNCVISLPIHTEMNEEELGYITKNFLEVVEKLSK